MLNFIFMILMIVVFGKILKFAIKMAWGVSKIICSVILLPIALIFLLIKGLLEIAFPILIIVAVISLFAFRDC